jgi:hypothetical protein
MENLRKKNQTEILEIKSPFSQTNKQKTTEEGHSSILEQVEDRISEIKDKIELKKQNRRNISQTTQEL